MKSSREVGLEVEMEPEEEEVILVDPLEEVHEHWQISLVHLQGVHEEQGTYTSINVNPHTMLFPQCCVAFFVTRFDDNW
jgi:hypothetical protein